MALLIVTLLGIFSASLFFSQSVRNFALAGYYFVGSYSPTLSRWILTAWGWIRRQGLAIIIVAVVFTTTMILLLPTAIFIFAAINGQVILGLGIALLLVLWTVSKPFSQIWILGKLTAPARILSGIMLIVLVPLLITKVVIGEEDFNLLLSSSKELTSAKIAEVASSMDVETSQSSKMSGMLAKISQSNVIMYDNDYIEKKVLIEGELVMADPKTTKKDPATEGMTWVTSRGPSGDIINGISGWVPTRFLDYEWKKKGISPLTTNTPSVGWEKVGECKIPFSGRVFDDRVGPNGERPLTGEVFTQCPVLENGYSYKITYAGKYDWNFAPGYPWHEVSWQGWNPQSQGIEKPFPFLYYGALMLRIGNKGSLHPQKKENFILFNATEDVKIFAELNLNRESLEYYNPSVGLKIKNSTLSLIVERRPLL